MTHEACWRLVRSISIAISFRTTDLSAFFIALTMPDLGRAKPNRRSNDMTWRIYFVLAVVMTVLAFSHILALQKLNAMQSERPATVDLLVD
jgi:hypothetical protein